MKKIILALIVAVSTLAINAQGFEGKVEFKYTYNKLPDGMEAYKAMLPQNMNILIKGNKSRINQSMGMGMNMAVISDSKTKEATVLMDMMGKKIAYVKKPTKEEIAQIDSVKVVQTKLTKTIAGYLCKKSLIIVKKDTMNVWYTDKIPNVGEGMNYKGIKGFFMEYSVKKQGMDITMTATKITKVKVDDVQFVIPEDYTLKTEEELKKMVPGMDK